MNDRDYQALLFQAHTHASGLGEIIATYIPKDRRLELFAALLDQMIPTEQARMLRVFEAGLLAGINMQVRQDMLNESVSKTDLVTGEESARS